MTYSEFVSQFPIYDNPPKKDVYDRHHIVPESEQKKLYGDVVDNRQIYVTKAQHLWAHILYDRENNAKTATWLLKLCGKTIDYFDSLEKCLAYSQILEDVRDRISESRKGIAMSDEWKEHLSKARKGKNTNELKPVCAYLIDGTFFKQYPSLKDARTDTGANNICKVLKGHLNQSGGYIWKYAE